MQERHQNRKLYFDELAETSRRYYIDYINKFYPIKEGSRILEIGCGDGGNLLPFAERGCDVTGIDKSNLRIEQAKEFFGHYKQPATFHAIDFHDMKPEHEEDKYEIIILHDVIEHITKKQEFINSIKPYMRKNAIAFIGFPAWQMPFGGHQQICRNRYISKLPFMHLLPKPLYKSILSTAGESEDIINELLDIKECATEIELFENLLTKGGYNIVDKQFWFINPHYEIKYNLKPRKLYPVLGKMMYLRNFFTTSCFYIISN